MKTFLISLLIILSISAAYAGGFMMLHVGSADGNGGVISTCDGTVDLSEGCPQPMLGL